VAAPQLTLGFPTAPPASVEQAVLPIRGTIEERYRAWRTTEPDVYTEIERRAVARAEGGATRVETNKITADVRGEWRVKINNDFRALIARDLRTAHPILRPLIHVRARRAR